MRKHGPGGIIMSGSLETPPAKTGLDASVQPGGEGSSFLGSPARKNSTFVVRGGFNFLVRKVRDMFEGGGF